MPRKDTYHDTVKEALVRDGWKITHDPYPLKFSGEDLYVDLGAERPLAAEKDGHKIAVEIKSFLGKSPVTDLERALGQFALYRFLVQRREPERILYLAVPDVAYEAVFDTSDARDLIAALSVRILVFNADNAGIIRWID